MLIKRIYERGAIKAYYKVNGSDIRYPLFKTAEKNVSKVNYRLKANPDEYDYLIENEHIDKLASKINSAIIEILKKSPKSKLTIKKIDDELGIIKIESTGIVDDLDRFISDRWKEYAKDDSRYVKLFPPGLKDYRSLKNALLDYQYDEKKTLVLGDVDTYFLDDFIDYLFDERPKKADDGYKYKSDGNLANKTLNKRLESFSAFVRAFYKKEDIASLIYSNRYSLLANDVIRITKDELKMLSTLEVESETDSVKLHHKVYQFI